MTPPAQPADTNPPHFVNLNLYSCSTTGRDTQRGPAPASPTYAREVDKNQALANNQTINCDNG